MSENQIEPPESLPTNLSELRYAGGTFVVDDDICKALFAYAQALAAASSTDVVSVPSIVEGVRVESSILLGATAQIWCSPVSGRYPDVTDADLVRDIRSKIDFLQPRATMMPQTAVADEIELDYGF